MNLKGGLLDEAACPGTLWHVVQLYCTVFNEATRQA